MDRRTFVSTAAGALLVRTFPAQAQPAKKIPRIGVLYVSDATYDQAFSQGLREHGYVINMKTAKALGLTIPPSLLRRADEVIQ